MSVASTFVLSSTTVLPLDPVAAGPTVSLNSW